MQWKRHYQSKLSVLIAQNKAISDIQKNCEDSDVFCSEFHLSFERQPGDVQLEQKDKEIHACQCPTNVLLHLEAFDFVYGFIFSRWITGTFSKILWNHWNMVGGGQLFWIVYFYSSVSWNVISWICIYVKWTKTVSLFIGDVIFGVRMIDDKSQITCISFWRATQLFLRLTITSTSLSILVVF